MKVRMLHQRLVMIHDSVKAFWLEYKKYRTAVVGLIILVFLIFVGAFAPLLAPYDPFSVEGKVLMPPEENHIFGTDYLGRDIFSRCLLGTRTSLLIGFSVAFFGGLIGMMIGALSGYYGGLLDDLFMRVTEFFMIIPRFFFALTIVAIFGTSIINLILVMILTYWQSNTRLIRSEVIKEKESLYVEAARALGCGDLHIILFEVLPNSMTSLIVNSSLQVGSAIILEASLSFLGLGDPSQISLGIMLESARLFPYCWWMAVFPGLLIAVTVFSLNLVGDGLNDVWNPKKRTLLIKSQR